MAHMVIILFLFILCQCYVGQAVQNEILTKDDVCVQAGHKNRRIAAGKYHFAVRMRPHIALNLKLYAEYVARRKRGVQIIAYRGDGRANKAGVNRT